MTVRYYVDADTLGLAHNMVTMRSDVTYPGDPGGTVHRRTRPACIITTTKTPDQEWIPKVAAEGWSIITRDAAILRRPAELDLVKLHGAKLFTITSTGKLHNWELLEVVMCNWRKIEEWSQRPGPFVFTLTRTTMKQVTL